MKRLLACLFAAFLMAGIVVPVVSAAARPAKVVIVVGPVGPGVTDRFRAQADEAARIARRYTPDVTVIASPNATWSRVKAALQDASVVVYMGHGNGWPSRYRDDLFPPTQNGFGLNPVAGGSDSKHQYFGEKYVGDQIKLAKNAVVLLHHLCYASGNTEPGLSEGTLAQAKQRVDNYAAGFIRAGAAAVSADAYSSPAYMIRSVLQGSRSIDRIWRAAPSAHGHTFAFKSSRSPGYVAQMDPDNSSSGFHRSIVLRKGLASKDVLANGRGAANGGGGASSVANPAEEAAASRADPDRPGHQGRGAEGPGHDDRRNREAAACPARGQGPRQAAEEAQGQRPLGSDRRLGRPGRSGSRRSRRRRPQRPKRRLSRRPHRRHLRASQRRPPIRRPHRRPQRSRRPHRPTSRRHPPSRRPHPRMPRQARRSTSRQSPPASDAGAPAPSEEPKGDSSRKPRVQPQPTPEETIPEPAAPPDEVLLIQPEQVGDVVQPVAGHYKKYGVDFEVTMPKAAGLYRLTVTLHDPDGVAYDAATQALLSPMLVRVVGPFDAKVLATDAATLDAGTNVDLAVRVANLGTATWGEAAVVDHGRRGGGSLATSGRVVGHWVALDGGTSNLAPVDAALPSALEPGTTVDATLGLAVPATPGQYLLILDVVTPDKGSLASIGVPPTMVRVTVLPAP